MSDHTFTVNGRAVGKERARVSNGHAYTPGRTAAWESAVGWSVNAQLAAADHDAPLLPTGEVKIVLDFFIRGGQRPDADNLAKSVLDGCNGILYRDDKQVTDLHVRVHNCPADDQRVEIVVSQ